MKNLQKGFVIPLVIVIIAVLAIGAGVYVYKNSQKSTEMVPNTSTNVESTSNSQQNTSTSGSVNSVAKISKITGPTSLNNNESGTWQIETNNPQDKSFMYGVIWGDEPEYRNVFGGMSLSAIKYQTSPSFSHAFSVAAGSKLTTWTPTFFVKDSNGNVMRKGISVDVQLLASGIFSASPAMGSAPLNVTFKNTIQSAGDTSINYGDGASCSTANPDGSQNCNLYTHTYTKAGTYTAILYRHLPTTELARVTITVK